MGAEEISNLDLTHSTRYAQDRELFDDAIIKESVHIPAQTIIATTEPSYPSEFDALFGLEERGKQWATFAPPPYPARIRAFSTQLIPGLGSPEHQEAQLERIDALPTTPESEKIHSLLTAIHTTDTLFLDSNAKRRQYQKG